MTPILRALAGLGLLSLVVACASAPPPTKPLAVGSRVAPATLLDQNEVPRAIDENVRIIFFAREMEGGAVIRSLLEEEDASYLEQNGAVYVADISGMPSLIANLVAIPKMQKERPYPTLLDRDGSTTAPFPGQEGQVTVLLLDNLRVTAIDYRDSLPGLREAVSQAR